MDSKSPEKSDIATIELPIMGDIKSPASGNDEIKFKKLRAQSAKRITADEMDGDDAKGVVLTQPSNREQLRAAERWIVGFQTEIEDNPRLYKLATGESVFQGLCRLAKNRGDTYMISKKSGNYGCCANVIIHQGSLGLAVKNGRTHFIPPGNYAAIGYNVSLEKIVEVESSNVVGTQFSHKDISYVNLPENHVAVVQGSEDQFTLAAGRYILQKPVRLYGICNVQNLKNSAYTKTITEKPTGRFYPDGCEIDQAIKVKIKSGEYETIGSLTFVRAEPGFAFVTQTASGDLNYDIGFGLVRGGEVFKQFVDLQHHARTTRWFKMETKDRQEVKVRIQVRWRIENPVTWVKRKGTNDDIFQAVEENIQALVLESITGHTYEHCIVEAGKGFSGFESTMRPRLTKHIVSLGGNLLGFEIRSIRFPLLDKRNKDRAEREAKVAEQILEEKRKKEIEDARRERVEEKKHFEMSKASGKTKHKTAMNSIWNVRQVNQQEDDAIVEEMKTEMESKEREIILEARKQAEVLKQKIALIKEKGTAERFQIEQKAIAEERLIKAQAEAKAEMIRAEAKAKSTLAKAKAKAKSADLMGKAFKSNKGYVDLKRANTNVGILQERANTLEHALARNKAALMPESYQKKLAMIENGFSPIPPVAFEDGMVKYSQRKIP